MTRTCFVDSSAFLSLEDPDETSHARTLAVFDELVSERSLLVTTNFVVDETYTLLLTRLGRSRAVSWGEAVQRGPVRIERVSGPNETRAWDIIVGFTDKDFSYTDATSFAVAEALGIDEALALDAHFRRFGQLRVLP